VSAGFVVTLFPNGIGNDAEIEIREKRCRTGYRVTLAQLYTILAMRAANIQARGRKSKGI
jgi:hypothetical protein